MRQAAILLCLVFATSAGAAPAHRVFGYAYSGDDITRFRWDLLSDVAFFSEPLHTDGTLPTTSWLGTAGKNMVAAAHANGVKCELAVTLMNTSTANNVHTFLASPAAIATAVDAMVSAVAANGADGISIDFEFVSGTDKALFTGFIQDLAAAMHAQNPKAEVSVAMPAVTYPGYDIAALGAAADLLFVMGYDFHWAGGPPGPVAPLQDSSTWGAGSQKSSIALFTAKVDPKKVVMGCPLYGYQYFTTSTAVPGTKVTGTTASAITYRSAEVNAATYGRLWDSASSTPYYLWVDSTGAQRQTFYDDAESFGLKLDQIVASGIGGVGLWELSYAAPSAWATVETKIGFAPPPGSGPDAGPDGALTMEGGCQVAAGPARHRGAAGVAILASLALVVVRRRRRRVAAPRAFA